MASYDVDCNPTTTCILPQEAPIMGIPVKVPQPDQAATCEAWETTDRKCRTSLTLTIMSYFCMWSGVLLITTGYKKNAGTVMYIAGAHGFVFAKASLAMNYVPHESHSPLKYFMAMVTTILGVVGMATATTEWSYSLIVFVCSQTWLMYVVALRTIAVFSTPPRREKPNPTFFTCYCGLTLMTIGYCGLWTSLFFALAEVNRFALTLSVVSSLIGAVGTACMVFTSNTHHTIVNTVMLFNSVAGIILISVYTPLLFVTGYVKPWEVLGQCFLVMECTTVLCMGFVVTMVNRAGRRYPPVRFLAGVVVGVVMLVVGAAIVFVSLNTVFRSLPGWQLAVCGICLFCGGCGSLLVTVCPDDSKIVTVLAGVVVVMLVAFTFAFLYQVFDTECNGPFWLCVLIVFYDAVVLGAVFLVTTVARGAGRSSLVPSHVGVVVFEPQEQA
eukprot:TRINITY_DN31501_c0_g1_i1.p1 TRINITY_DN31501_c0_g1~~TRINITY_DN31501_c0_g1_i1.p1  ORF type:complete len:441 (+),score=42.35 TRINITY_DN31501_c0_g1_i1:89-1411(+)